MYGCCTLMVWILLLRDEHAGYNSVLQTNSVLLLLLLFGLWGWNEARQWAVFVFDTCSLLYSTVGLALIPCIEHLLKVFLFSFALTPDYSLYTAWTMQKSCNRRWCFHNYSRVTPRRCNPACDKLHLIQHLDAHTLRAWITLPISYTSCLS